MTRYEIEQATEYPFFAVVLPFKDKRFRSSLPVNELINTVAITPTFGVNVIEKVLH